MHRPDLTWRDVQHIFINSAAMINPDDADWETTAQGRKFSYKYGFGKLDAYAFVSLARTWQNVKPQAWMNVPTIELADARMEGDVLLGGEPIVQGGVKSDTIITRDMLEENNLEKLEHITVKVWISHDRRGDVEVALTSPAGVESILASKRRLDTDDGGFVGWTFMTLKHWCVGFHYSRKGVSIFSRDENPAGKWTLKVSDQNNDNKGFFLGWSMTLWGSAIDPDIAELYELPDEPNEGHNLPPHPTASEITTHHSKPTQALPEDHASQSGEASFPAFSSSPSATNSPETDKSCLTSACILLYNHSWLIVAIGIVALFGIGAGVFFYMRRRKIRRARSNYAPLPGGDNMPMRALDRSGPGAEPGAQGSGERSAGGTRELYDAFGVGSDEDDEDEDEHTALTASGRMGQPSQISGYHDGFLDDEGMSTARTAIQPYRDEPEGAAEGSSTREASTGSPRHAGSDESGDGSWQDAAESDHLRS